MRLSSNIARFLLLVGLPALLIALLIFRPPAIEADLTALIPSEDLSAEESQLIDRSLGKLGERIVVVVEGDSVHRAIQLAQTMLTRLDDAEDVTVNWAINPDSVSQMQAELMPYAPNFVLDEQLDDEQVKHWLLQKWYGVERTASQLQHDPLLINYGIEQYLQSLPGEIEIFENYPFIRDDGRYFTLLIISGTGIQHFDWQHNFEQTLASLNQSNKSVYATGSARYEYAAVSQAKREVSWLGGLSVVLIVGLLFAIFRRLGIVLWAFYPMCLGVAGALVLTSWVFPKIHLFTLVFGTSLLGMTSDYVFHWLVARANGQQRRARQPLLLAALSTFVVFLAQAFSGTEVLAQMGVFAAIGVAISVLTVVTIFPRLWAKSTIKTHLTAPGVTPLKPKASRAMLVVLCVVLAASVYSTAKTNDDIRSFQPINAALKADEDKIRSLLGLPVAPGLFIFSAPNMNLLLENMAEASTILRDSEAFDDVRTVTDLIRPYEHQSQAKVQITEWFEPGGLYEQMSAVLPLSSDYTMHDLFEVLTLERAAQLSIFERYEDLVYQERDRQVVAIMANPTRAISSEFIEVTQIAELGGRWVDRAALVSEALAKGRQEGLVLLAVSLLLAWLIFIKHFGRMSGSFALLIVGCAVCGSIVAASIVGFALNIFALLAALLIVGLSIDYVVFALSEGESATTPILCSALTTFVAFGMLSFSAVPVLQQIGVTIATGILVAVFLALTLRRI